MNYPKLSDELLTERLSFPGPGKLRMILDTDTYNEVDDQFALCQAVLSPDRLEVEAIYAAPFHNPRSTSPADGMQRSYDEIQRILKILGKTDYCPVYKGSDRWMKDDRLPVESDAARELVRRAKSEDKRPLYVVAIGAITNVASAIQMDPGVIERIIVVWLGGHDHAQTDTKEFNLNQDLNAAHVILDSGVPLVQIPCYNVASHLNTTVAELNQYLKGKNAIGTYLADIVESYIGKGDPYAWSKVIWDISATSWLIEPKWLPSRLVPTPILNSDVTWGPSTGRHMMRVVTRINRDPIFRDVFKKITSVNA